MAKLLVQESGAEAREFDLVDAEVHIGRELDNALRIPDPSISRHHCVIRKAVTGFEIQDLQSSNGVLVNGNRVQASPLKHGDRVTLGQIQITFLDPDAAANEGATVAIQAVAAENPAGTVRMSADQMAALHASVAPAKPPVSVPPPPPPEPAGPQAPQFGHFTDPGQAARQPLTPQGASMSSGTITKPDANPVLALILTWFVLGTGHYFINGQQRKWLYTLIACLVGTLLCCIPGIIISICSIIDAYQTAERLQKGETIGENEYTFPLLFKIMSKVDKEATCTRV
ncbi:MAG TPA: FHA domain-containing protein [Holophagaceae bacterium]|jgi:hypothetical protein|nr:FHA domain-containing protein [Holophagaceae bacterium]